MKTINIYTALILLIFTCPAFSQAKKFTKPHDVDPDINISVPHVNKTPLALNTNDAPLVFTNVDISNNTAPQNEPTVKFSRTDPMRVIAAWRDFRLGIDPTAVRRVGYSFSTDGGMTWSVSALLDSTLLPGGLLRNSDPAATTDTAGNFYITTIALDNGNGNGTLAIYKSTDQGLTFPTASIISQTGSEDKEYITTDLSTISPFRNNLYISWTSFSLGANVLVRSTNSGLNWSAPVTFSTDTTFGQGSDLSVSLNGQVNVAWVGGNVTNDILYVRSTDGGLTFSTPVAIASGPLPSNLPNGAITFPSICADPNLAGRRRNNLYCVFSDERNGDADVFLVRSTNNGTTWSNPLRINNDQIGNGQIQYWPWVSVNENGVVAVVFFDTRNTPTITTIEAWLARSTDQGLTFTNELLSTQQSTTDIPGGNVRFGDYMGVDFLGNRVVTVWPDERAGGFNIDIYTAIVDQPVTVANNSNGIPLNFELMQNYPNPFNPSTTIWFSLPKASDVTLSIYNSLGQVIETPINQSLGAGKFSVRWDASKYSSGIYFYKLTTSGGFTETKKMMLIK